MTAKHDNPAERERTAAAAPARRMGDWFDLEFPAFFRWFEDRRPSLFGPDERIRLEEEIDEGVLHVRAEAPGIDPQRDAEVTIEDGVLRLTVQRRKEERSEEEGRVRSEFRYGSFTRTVALPKGTDSSQVTATYDNGILDVTVPIPEPTGDGGQRIAIESS